MNAATTALAAQYTATAVTLRNGSRRITVVCPDGSVVNRTTKAAYAWVNLQGWDSPEYAGQYALRFSAKPKPVGAAIEYGKCYGSVPITEA